MLTRPEITIHPLSPDDEAEVMKFELVNRAYFARAVGDRGEAYFDEFTTRYRGLIDEIAGGTVLMYLIRDASGRLIGRVNLVDIADGIAELGYRIGEQWGGRGHATAAVHLVLAAAADHGLTRVTAKVTSNNLASQRVLERTGFVRQPSGTPTHLTVGGVEHPAIHFVHKVPSIRSSK